MLIAFAKLADQPERLLGRRAGSFQVENQGFDRGFIEQRQDLVAGAQKCGVKGGRQHFLRRKLDRLVRGDNCNARCRASGYGIHRHVPFVERSELRLACRA